MGKTPQLGSFRYSSNRIIARAQAIEAAQSMLNERALILEVEATSFSDAAQVYEIAILDVSGDLLFHSFVKPLRTTVGARQQMARPDFDEQIILAAPKWKEIYPQIVQILTGQTIVAYNAKHIVNSINQSCFRSKLPTIEWANVHCAMTAYAAYFGSWNSKYGEYTFQSLPFSKNTALADALAVHRLINHIASTPMPENIPRAIEYKPFEPVEIVKEKEVQKHLTSSQQQKREIAALAFWFGAIVGIMFLAAWILAKH